MNYSHRLFIKGPCCDFEKLLSDFAVGCSHVQIIGSFSLLEYIPKQQWVNIITDDLDFQFFFNSKDEVEFVGKTLKENGFYSKENRVGKWINIDRQELEADIVVTSIGVAANNPYCLPEPFANVAHCDACISKNITSMLGIENSGNIFVSGWLSGLLGKSLKVNRYLGLEDWNANTTRQKHGQKACSDMCIILDSIEFVSTKNIIPHAFVRNYKTYSDLTREPLLRSVNALDYLLGSKSSIGYKLASEWRKEISQDNTSRQIKVSKIKEEIAKLVL